ncbi:hypothetical protein [Chromobacterium subtsugae]|uniref:hypothetical protein n=1 Tax=Chromobacterium subtsugae TaxID=251747 RepID=UPI000640BCDD|nr:hypothetical protein [Chromobacterium subtsugae]
MRNQAIIGALCCAFWGCPAFASADDAKPAASRPTAAPGYSVKTITPIYSQLLLVPMPRGFDQAYEEAKPVAYIQESVLSGETVERWSQMITLTGRKDLALNPNVTLPKLAMAIAGGFKKDCPDSFSAQALRQGKLDGYDAFTMLMQCGTSPATGGRTSESALIAVIKGARDYYTVQWAERSSPSSAPLPIDSDKWTARYQLLVEPIRLCNRTPGEAPPYPSCINDKPKKNPPPP